MYYFIVNPYSRSGHGLKIWNKIEKYLDLKSIAYQAFLTERPRQATEYAELLTKGCQEPRILVVVGGDGTFNEVLDGLSFCDRITLGYIPTGTSNDLARGLKLPYSPVRCLKRILYPKFYKQLDYGVVTYGEEVIHHRRFIVSAGIGLDAAVCHNLSYSGCKRFFNYVGMRRLPYVVIGLKQYLKAKPARGYILLDGVKRVEFNNIYFISAQLQPSEGGGCRFAPKADSSDGKLDICVVSHSSRLEVLSVLLRAFFKRKKNKGIRVYRCREAKIHTERPLAVHADGESCQYQRDMEVRCIERKIRIIV